jgi:hypothetical protein
MNSRPSGARPARLKQHANIRCMLQLHMFFARISWGLASGYRRLVEAVETEPAQNCRSVQVQQQQQQNKKRQDEQANDAGPANRWDWREFPGQISGTSALTHVSTCWMVYAILRTLFYGPLSRSIDPLSEALVGLPGHCLLMGRLFTHQLITDRSSMMLALFHLIWRSIQRFARRDYQLNLFYFLLHTDADIDRFYRLLAADREHRPEYSAPLSSVMWLPPNDDDREPDEPSDPDNDRRWTEQTGRLSFAMLVASKSCPSLAPAPSRRIKSGWRPNAVDFNERLLRHAMCYQVHYGHKLYYRLRPNRSAEARRLLAKRVSVSFLVNTGILAALTMYFSFYVSVAVLSDERYAATYPGCSGQPDRPGVPVAALHRVAMQWHQLVSACVDMLENIIIWFDCGMSAVYVPTLAYLLNCDILTYLCKLNAQLEQLLERTRLRESIRRALLRSRSLGDASCLEAAGLQSGETMFYELENELAQMGQVQRDTTSGRPTGRRQQPPAGRLERSNRCCGALAAGERVDWSPIWAQFNALGDQLELEINEIQCQIYDFFHEVKRVDLLISDILSLSIFIWLTCCAGVGYNCLIDAGASIPTQIGSLLVLGFIAWAAATYFLLELHRNCLKTYNILCSLMAHDRSKQKRRFIKILDFFTHMNRTTYTLLQSYPYRPTTFITIIGWSVSCFALAFTLLGQKRLYGGKAAPVLDLASL